MARLSHDALLAIGVLFVAVGLIRSSPASATTPASSCDLGWFVVDGEPLVVDDVVAVPGAVTPAHAVGSGSVHGRVVSLVSGYVEIEGICPPVALVVKQRRTRSILRARWDGCPGVKGRVSLRASLDTANCDRLQGRIVAKRKRSRRRRFEAYRSFGDPADCNGEDTFQVIQQRILGAKGCRVASCHGEFHGGGLDLRANASHFGLVGKPATMTAVPGELRVAPGHAETSFLWRKLTGRITPGEGNRMPATGAGPLDALELELVRTWIEAGAPAVGIVPGSPCLPRPQFEPAPGLGPPPGGHLFVFDGPVLQPGEESEGCIWFELANDAPFPVGRWEYSINPGSHHFGVWAHAHGPVPPLGRFIPGDVSCLRSGAAIDGNTISAASESPYFVDAFPPGVGNVLEPHKLLGFNPHFYNEFDGPIQMKAWVSLQPVEGPLRHTAERLFSGMGDGRGTNSHEILVEPFSIGVLGLRMVNELDRPMQVFQLSAHQHKRGTRLTAWDPSGEKIFENFDWSHPAIRNFETPYVIAPGSYVDFECEWDNGITREVRRCGDTESDVGCVAGEPMALRFGLSAEDEMCILVGYYYVD